MADCIPMHPGSEQHCRKNYTLSHVYMHLHSVAIFSNCILLMFTDSITGYSSRQLFLDRTCVDCNWFEHLDG